nr:uroporphyrinogen decarboxylase [Campylobacter sp.]
MIFVDACFGKDTPYTPIWMMRQAGRYLPEYRELRASVSDFVAFCKDSQKSALATLQPIDRLGVDAAILFSDILVVPLEMGMDLEFKAGIGPVFASPIETMKDLDKLKFDQCAKNLSYVYDTIKIVRSKLSSDKALIGFCGAPWTLATYMVEGAGSKTYTKVKKMLYANPQFMHSILRKITNVLKEYLEEQIKAGVNAVQIFDSWAGALEESAYLEFGFSYLDELCAYIKEKYPHIPVIAFPKGVGAFLGKLKGKFDVFGVDWNTPISVAKTTLGKDFVLQGNLEPCRLYNQMAIEDGVMEILSVMKGKRHIFNLGHGILPDVPVENAKYLIDLVRKESKKFAK